MKVKNSPGIYSFYIPSIDSWYVGSSVDIAKRYAQHMKKSHVNLLNKHKDELVFKVITYLEVESIAEIRKKEQHYIDNFLTSGKTLINKKSCNVSVRQVSNISVYQYNLKGEKLNFFITKADAIRTLKIPKGRVGRLLEGSLLYYKDYVLVYKKDTSSLKRRIRLAKHERAFKARLLKDKKKKAK